MKRILFFTVISMLIMMTSCNEKKAEKTATATLDLANLDTTAVPGDDFYQYATGGWQKLNPIPDENSRYGSFDKLREATQKQVQDLIEELSKTNSAAGSNEQKVGDLYKMAMDSVKLNADGAKPIQSLLAEIATAKEQKDVIRLITKVSKYADSPFFAFFVAPDDLNSSMNIAHIYQGGIGMGDRDYYLEQTNDAQQLRNAYVKLMETQFKNAGYANPSEAAANVMKIEMALAKSHFSKEKLRLPEENYHKILVKDLEKKVARFDWNAYFGGIGIKSPDSINVAQVEPLKAALALIQSEPLQNIKDYLSWKVIDAASPYLSDNFVDANFEFYGKAMSGAKQNRPRWKRSVDAVSAALGEAVGEVYVKKYFPAEAKKRMLDLVNNLMTSFGERIQALAWMSDATKAKALDKLKAFTVKIGYPDKWKDYSSLEIKNDSYFANIMRASDYEHRDMMKDLGKPVDKTKWAMTPQTVNAYYNPSANEIVFPAGILQPPFFYMDGDDAINYGAIGVVIGHEMTHGFDDQGSKFDKEGNLANWWLETDTKNFNARTDLLVKHFDGIVVIDSLHANGTFTLGENIADHGGLQISYQAFQKTAQAKENKAMDGFTPAQRFFLSYANVWAGNIRDEEIRRLTKIDPHSLGKWRVNGALPHIDAWYEAFNIKEGDKLYLPKEKRSSIW